MVLRRECYCGSSENLRFTRYYFQGELLGVCCTDCQQEWLQRRFTEDADTMLRFRTGTVFHDLWKYTTPELKVDRAFQVHSDRTPIRNKNIFSEYFEKGDQVAWHRRKGIWHHAIVTDIDARNGKMEVIHNDGKGIKREWKTVTSESGTMYRINYESILKMCNPPELVIARAQSRVGDNKYKLFKDNCETFATFCKIGVRVAQQVRWFYRKVFSFVVERILMFPKDVVKVFVGSKAAKNLAEAAVKNIAKVGYAETVELVSKASDAVG